MFRRIVPPLIFAALFGGTSLGVLLQLQPVVGVLWGVALGVSFVAWQLHRNRMRPTHYAHVRMSRPRGDPRVLVVACVSSIVFLLGTVAAVEFIAPLDVDDLGIWARVLEYQRTKMGWLAVMLIAGVVVPIVEEFSFRGYIQGALESRLGVGRAIVLTSSIFMIAHVGGPNAVLLLVPLVLGVWTGLSVSLFGSIWIAVLVHSCWNILMGTFASVGENPARVFGLMPAPRLLALSVVLLAFGGLGWYWTFRRVNQTERQLIPLSESSFGYSGLSATVTFVRDRTGKVIGAVESARVAFARFTRVE